MQGLYLNQKNKPKITFFSGWKEVEEIFMQSLQAQQIFGFGSTLQFANLDRKFFDWYEKELFQKKTIFYDLLTADSQTTIDSTKKRLGKLYEAKLLPKQFKSLPSNILIWDDNIALLTFQEPIFGTVLTNPVIRETLQTFFQALWQAL